MYFLYYAGMAADNENEQIGLALSRDGKHFEKVNGDGLILKRDADVNWKSLRVCNPTVLFKDERFWMFYLGISKEGNRNVSIGLARSLDGIKWDCEETPCLPWQQMRSVDSKIDESSRVGVVEPAVIFEKGCFKMWFVYINKSHPGHSLYYAESSDGQKWDILSKPLLSGSQFGDMNIHYPQVIATNSGYELWFTLRNNKNGVFGIFQSHSHDGFAWETPRQVLPASSNGITLKPRSYVGNGWGLRFLNCRIAKYFQPSGNRFLGYAHPHILEEGNRRVMYYHGDNAGKKGLWLDVGRCEIEGGEIVSDSQILQPNSDQSAWDHFFVGDPFVLSVNS